MQHLLIEDLDLVRLVAKKDSSHLLSGSITALELVGSQLSLQISKNILHSTEFWSVGRVVEHFQKGIPHDFHNFRVLVGVQVIMLKHQLLLRVLSLHLLHQVTEVINICFMGLSSFLKKLHLFTAMSRYTHGAGQVLGQELLSPLPPVNKRKQSNLPPLALLFLNKHTS